jgi:Raf kinase inhibitor-like YbhB/YbcL family protein
MKLPVKILFSLTVGILGTFCLAKAQTPHDFAITSPAFAPGGAIPPRYTCKNATAGSPELRWQGPPESAKSLALIVEDPDAPGGTFIHWVVYDIPTSVSKLDAGVPPTGQLAAGGLQGVNSFDKIGYMGPCPPPGSEPHHYHFKLMALDATLGLKPGVTAAQVEAASRGHVQAQADLVGTFAR